MLHDSYLSRWKFIYLLKTKEGASVGRSLCWYPSTLNCFVVSLNPWSIPYPNFPFDPKIV